MFMKNILQNSRESIVRRASLLRLSAAVLAENMQCGSFKSLYRGHGIDFNGVREYLPGDDVRFIDWNVTARMDKPFVKTFEEEKELPVFLVIDQSLSMNTGSEGKTRLQQACETGALLVLAAEQTLSPAGVVFFDDKIRFSCVPKNGKTHTMMLLSRLDETSDDVAAGSALDQALRGALKLLRKRSLVFVLSDFRSSGWENPIALLAAKHDVLAVRITDPIDSALQNFGTVSFIDTESDAHLTLPTSSESFQTAWYDDNVFRKEKWKKFCISHACRPVVMSTKDDPLHVLLQIFSKKEPLR